MASNSQHQGVSVRHDIMGRGIVVEILSNRALLSSEKGDILVTPKDTYNDAGVNLTERLRKGDEVVYKAVRNHDSSKSNVRHVANYVRRLNNCVIGEGKISSVVPNYAFVDPPNISTSNRSNRVFFPTSGLYEPSIESLIRQHTHADLTKILRLGDPMTFVAVKDTSNQERCAYGIEVCFAFNREKSQRKIGIITTVRQSECEVWAKNFCKFIFTISASTHLRIDDPTAVDLRDILHPGTRIQFIATADGDVDGISRVEITDEQEKLKLSKYQAKRQASASNGKAVQGKIVASTASGQNQSKAGNSGNPAEPQQSANVAQPKEPQNIDVMHQIEQELADFSFDEEEDEENVEKVVRDNSIVYSDVPPGFEGYNPIDMTIDMSSSQSPTFASADQNHFQAASEHSSQSYSGRSSAAPDTASKIVKQRTDAECQASCPGEIDMLNEILQDEAIFKLVCDRYTPLVHKIWQDRRW